MKLINTTKLVKSILGRMPETRDDDYLLWLKVIEKVAEYENIPDFSKTMTVGVFLTMAKQSNIPPYDSVSRARRKLQMKYPELRGSAKVQAHRKKREARYRKYAKYD